MNKASHNLTLISVAAVLLADALFFGFTNAATVTSQALIIGYLLAVATTYVVADMGLRLSRAYGIRLGAYHRRVAFVITGVVGAVLALVSVGQFTPRDLMVITPLIILGGAYIGYGKMKRTNLPSNS